MPATGPVRARSATPAACSFAPTITSPGAPSTSRPTLRPSSPAFSTQSWEAEMESGYFDEETSAEVVIARNAAAKDARLAAGDGGRHPQAARGGEGDRADPGGMDGGDPVPDPHRAGLHRLAPGVHPAFGHARRLDAGRRDRQPQALGRQRKHRARAVPRRRRARAGHGSEHLPRRQGRADARPRPHPGRRRKPDRGRQDRRVAGQRRGLLRRPAEGPPARLQPPRRLPHRTGRRLLVPGREAEVLPDSGRRPGRPAPRAPSAGTPFAQLICTT